MAGLNGLRHLLQSPGWVLLNSHLEEQIKARTDKVILEPLKTHDGVFEQEFAKGEIQALRMVIQLPKTLVEQAEQFIKERADEDESTDGKTVGSAAP